MTFYNYKRDFAVGRQAEKEVAKLFKKFYGWEHVTSNKDNRYDLLLKKGDKEETVEVKVDFLCRFTNNLVVEYHCRGKKSGIQVTKAKYYLIKAHRPEKPIYILIRTSAIKKLIKQKAYKRIVNGGDKGSNSMNYLFDMTVLLNAGKTIFEN